MRRLVLAAVLCLLTASSALAGDAAVSAFYSPDRLGRSNPVFLSFSGAWDREGGRMLVLDAGMNYQAKFDASTYWLAGYGLRYQDRLGLALSTGGVATPRGGSFVIGPNVRIDLVGPLSLRYIGLQRLAAEKGSQVESFTHLIGVQIKTLSF
jgi:opacity protein-like surface antigen